MTEQVFRYLPVGCWINFGNFPFEASNEDFQAWLRERGIDLPIERISVSRDGHRILAVISIENPNDEAAGPIFNEVVNRIDGDPFMGRELHIFCPKAANDWSRARW